MNYAYNIKVNLNKRLYNFYEWKDADNIIIYNKLDVYVVDDQTYDDILKMRIKADDKQFSKYTCIFTNGIDTVCVRFSDNGEIELISKLDLEEESELLDEINIKNKYSLKYELIDKSNKYSYNTREENEIIDYLNMYILNNKDNNDLIDYLYNEWFHDNKSKFKYERLMNAVNGEFVKEHKELYDIVKLIV